MQKAQIHRIGADEAECDSVLKENFAKLMGDMSVGRLRQEMGHIGTSAIQSAKQGSKGMRLETLEKFASYFNVQPYQLLLPDLGLREWPFDLLTPDQLQQLPTEHLETVQKVALDLLKHSKRAGSPDVSPVDTEPSNKKNIIEGSIPKPDFLGQETSAQRRQFTRPPRKTGGG